MPTSEFSDILYKYITPSSVPGADIVSKTMQMNFKGDIAQQAAGIAGKAAGTAIAGPIGGMVGGTVLPMVVGGVESLLGKRKQKKAQGYLPPSEDPMERRRLQELDNYRKTFETGSAYANQLKQLSNIQSGTNRGILRASGGNTGTVISSLLRSGQNAATAYGEIAGEGTKRQDAYNAMYGDVLEKMAQRRAALQMQRYTQMNQEGGEMRKSGNQLLMQLLATAQNFKGTSIPASPNINTDDMGMGRDIIPLYGNKYDERQDLINQPMIHA